MRGSVDVWSHPSRVVTDLRVQGAEALTVRVAPGCVARGLVLAGARIEETIFVTRELPVAVIEWAARDPLDLLLIWRTETQRTWPPTEAAREALRYRVGDQSLTVSRAADRGEAGDLATFVFSSRPDRLTADPDEGTAVPALQMRAAFRLDRGKRVRMVVAASCAGWPDVEWALARIAHLRAEVVRTIASASARREEALALRAPGLRASAALEWAKYRLDAFSITTPGLGSAVVTGYGPSAGESGGGDSATCYAREAIWAALAHLAAGQFERARDVLQLWGRLQHVTGKIPGECSTSGAMRYDASDTTALYLLLAAWYLLWTADLSTFQQEREHVDRALAFCESMPTGDGLPTPARGDRPWIDPGSPGGYGLGLYEAAIWAAALARLADAMEAAGEKERVVALRDRAAAARAAFTRRLYDSKLGFYGARVRPDGTLDTAQTALQAVPLLVGVTDADQAASWLDAIAGPAFSTSWGVRSRPATDPGYDPASARDGVRPLLTGLVSWAEYSAGRARAAYRHWRANLDLMSQGERGAWAEVLHGRRRLALGSCSNSAGAAAMVVAPLVYGMLGVVPDAPFSRVRLAPQFPETWRFASLTNLRVGEARIRLDYQRQKHGQTFRIEQTAGDLPLTLVFEPALPVRSIAQVFVDGRGAQLETFRLGERTGVRVQMALDHERVLRIEV
ncbi:MAG: hypothetical protein HY701_07855 [Gemmatimonadetes bacterium]|nr:hypothetical protein [Gemmatimonadota bacterium]